MEKQTLYPGDRYPPTNCLAAAIKRLPHAGPDVPPQTIDIDAGLLGRYSVIFVVRQNPDHVPPTWFWGVESSERVAVGRAGSENLSDPESGGGGI